MQAKPTLLGLLGASALLLMAGSAQAATSSVQKQCSGQWAQMKADNKVPAGLKWPQFYSKCAAAAKDAAASSDDAQPAEPVANAKTPKPTKTAVVSDEGDTGSSAADKKACDTKWGDYKEGSGAHGWKAYFTFMAKCMPQG